MIPGTQGRMYMIPLKKKPNTAKNLIDKPYMKILIKDNRYARATVIDKVSLENIIGDILNLLRKEQGYALVHNNKEL